jgi:hypothetical protein
VLVLCAVPAMATASADLCRAAAEHASRSTGVPLPVLMAVSLTETGRSRGGRTEPWPWALNLGGPSVWADSRADALRRAQAALAAGQQNFDLGCFQINYRWHGQSFDSLDDMLDPDRNAAYAAQFLSRLHAQLGNWSAAAGRYHSATPVHATRYRQVFDTHLTALGGNGDDPPLQTVELRENRFPLLRDAGTAGGMGSLVPRHDGGGGWLSDAGGSLLGGPSQPFWSGS